MRNLLSHSPAQNPRLVQVFLTHSCRLLHFSNFNTVHNIDSINKVDIILYKFQLDYYQYFSSHYNLFEQEQLFTIKNTNKQT